MPLINSVISWLNIKRRHQIELFKKYPLDVQQETLMKILERAEKTEWGMKYAYKDIGSVRDYQDRLPLQHYEDIKPYVERLMRGEQNLLWPDDIRWFAKSSGTTGEKSKFIPVSRDALEECHFRGGKDIIAIHTENFPETVILHGKALALGGSRRISNFSAKSYYGDLSAILIQNLPFWVNFIKTPSEDIALIEKWEEKLEKIYSVTLDENVTNMAGVPSWMMVLLKYILQKTQKEHILEVWPNLELFIHGGVSFTPYRRQFEQLIPSSTMRYMETYNASEGFFAIQDDPGHDDMLLMLDYGIFYEFIPVESLEDEQPRALHVGEVETDRNYAIVISTNGGLWRYIIGDTISFSSLYPHKIRITGRTKHFINAFGEEVIIDNAEKAIGTACEKTGALVKEYSACPVFITREQKGGHEWVIEFEKEPEDLEYFTEMLDHALMSVNSDYEAKRYKDITLEKPVVHSVKPGVFHQWFSERGKLGGQNKIPRLSNMRKYVEELLDIHRHVL